MEKEEWQHWVGQQASFPLLPPPRIWAKRKRRRKRVHVSPGRNMDRCQCINQEGWRDRLSPIPEQHDSFFSSSGDENCEKRHTLYFPTPSNDTRYKKMTWAQLRRQQLCLDNTNVTSARFPQPHVLTFSPLREKKKERATICHHLPTEKRQKKARERNCECFAFLFKGLGLERPQSSGSRLIFFAYIAHCKRLAPQKKHKNFPFYLGSDLYSKELFLLFPFFLSVTPAKGFISKCLRGTVSNFICRLPTMLSPLFLCVVLGDISAAFFFRKKTATAQRS